MVGCCYIVVGIDTDSGTVCILVMLMVVVVFMLMMVLLLAGLASFDDGDVDSYGSVCIDDGVVDVVDMLWCRCVIEYWQRVCLHWCVFDVGTHGVDGDRPVVEHVVWCVAVVGGITDGGDVVDDSGVVVVVVISIDGVAVDVHCVVCVDVAAGVVFFDGYVVCVADKYDGYVAVVVGVGGCDSGVVGY